MTDVPWRRTAPHTAGCCAGPRKPSDRSLDAIVMPASRPTANLLPAMELAQATGGPANARLAAGRTGHPPMTTVTDSRAALPTA